MANQYHAIHLSARPQVFGRFFAAILNYQVAYHMLTADPSIRQRIGDSLQRITIQLDGVSHRWYTGNIPRGLHPWLDNLVSRIALELFPTIQSWLSLSRVSSAPDFVCGRCRRGIA